MKAKDLMIGDWVQVPCLIDNTENYNAWCQIKQLRDDDLDVIGFKELSYDEIEPIPLSPEILEKNGWIYNNEDEKFFPQTWVGGGLMLQGADDCGYRIVVTSDYDDEDTNDTPFIILYVHELQHALMLRRIKKEIIL